MSAESRWFIERLTEHDKPVSKHEKEDRELQEALSHIWEIAQELGLDPYPTHFEIVPARIINELGAYGLPLRFSHWTHGRQYRQLKTLYDWGLSKIYELVINSNPSQAFLLENNPPIENKFVMAHVLGHTDFFKNSQIFAATRKDMPEVTGRNAERIRYYEEGEGKLAVEQILDAALAIEEHVDPYLLHRPQKEEELRIWREQAEAKRKPQPKRAGEFDDFLGIGEKKDKKAEPREIEFHVPPAPDRDLLGFIRNHAPYLEEWQRDIVDIVRSESVYFYPQRRTKIMNEGWASYWHKRIMREMGNRNLITDQENETWWRLHSGVVAPSRQGLNPYYLGMTMFEYLEDYYNGNLTEEEKTWLKKEDIPLHPHFEGQLQDSPAAPMLRDIMIHNDDQSFIRNYFNKIVADRMSLYVYEKRTAHDGSVNVVVKEKEWEEIRDRLVASMTKSGNPYIVVLHGDYRHANELYLRHEFEEQSLDPEYVQKTLPYIYQLWQRPLHLETLDGKSDRKVVYTYDGIKVSR